MSLNCSASERISGGPSSVGARAREVARGELVGDALQIAARAGDRSCEEEADAGDRTEHDDGEAASESQ